MRQPWMASMTDGLLKPPVAIVALTSAANLRRAGNRGQRYVARRRGRATRWMDGVIAQPYPASFSAQDVHCAL